MVMFTCQHCGSSVKKTAVVKHYSYECRNQPYLTCVDCLKDFRGDEHVAHTSCVTEEERYSAKGFKSKAPSVKGAIKQESWTSSIKDCLSDPGLSPQAKRVLHVFVTQVNVPQKRVKFHNFAKNVLRSPSYNESLVNNVYDIITKVHERNKANNSSATQLNGKTSDSNGNAKEEDKSLTTKENSENIEDKESVVEKVSKKSKKKKSIGAESMTENDEKVQNSVEDFNDSCANMGDVEMDLVENNVDKKKKKDKKKKSMVSEESVQENGTEVSESSFHENGETNGKVNGETMDNIEVHSEKKLSKKERKEKRKREKYEAELNEIESYPKESEVACQEQNGDACEEAGESKKKKKRKNKDRQNSEQEGTVNGSASVDGEPCGKKFKHSEPEIPEVSSTAEPASTKNTFDWGETITKILHSRSDQELSINRLCKKVIDEYQTVCGGHATYEKLLAKFNKKVHKTPGVKVLKDKAKLVNNCT